MATISARVEGDARQILEVLAWSRSRWASACRSRRRPRPGAAASTFGCSGRCSAKSPFEDWRFTVDGTVRDFAGNMTTRRVALSQGQLTVRGDQRAVTVSGPIRAGASAIQNVRWTERIGVTGAMPRPRPSIRSLATSTPTILSGLGYPVARYAQGRIGVTVTRPGPRLRRRQCAH